MKKWYLSKTIQVGVLEFLIGCGMLVAEFYGAGDYNPQAYVLLVVGVLTIALRLITKEPIG